MSDGHAPSTPEEALAVALRLLRGRDKSRAQLEQALTHRGCDEKTTQEVLHRLEKLGYLNDERVAQERARRLLQTGFGPRGVAFKLEGLGIDEKMTLRALKAAQEQTGIEEHEQARGLLERRWPQGLPRHPREKAKAARLLLSRGFSESIVESLLGDGVLEFEDPAD
jgi:regulatory protein